MAEEPREAPAVEEQDTPEPEAPDAPDSSDAPETSVDYEKRYNDLVPEYTRTQQFMAALDGRHGPDLQEQALEAIGLGLEDEEEVEDYDEYEDDEDYEDEPMTRAEFQEYLDDQMAEESAVESNQMFLADLNDVVEGIEQAEGRTLSDQETQILYREAQAQVAETGTFDLEDSWDSLRNYSQAEIDRYVKSKREAALAPLGTAGEEKINLSDDDARRDLMSNIMDQASAEE